MRWTGSGLWRASSRIRSARTSDTLTLSIATSSFRVPSATTAPVAEPVYEREGDWVELHRMGADGAFDGQPHLGQVVVGQPGWVGSWPPLAGSRRRVGSSTRCYVS